MKPVFADTYYFVAAINPKDEAHDAALEATDRDDRLLITTAWVLTEVANTFPKVGQRQEVMLLFRTLAHDPRVEIIPPSPDLFQRGVELYCRRPDKDWSLTDCISFVVMSKRGMADALTADHHFEQAGFKALLK